MVSGSVSLPSRGPFHRSFTALTAAFQEYAAREIKREKKPTIQEQLQKAQAKRKTRERAEKPRPTQLPER